MIDAGRCLARIDVSSGEHRKGCGIAAWHPPGIHIESGHYIKARFERPPFGALKSKHWP